MPEKKVFYLVAGALLAVFAIALALHVSLPSPEAGKSAFSYKITGCGEKREADYSPARAPELVSAKASGAFLEVVHKLNYVCCADLKMYLDEIREENGVKLVKLREKNEGEFCRCMCEYEATASIGPLEKGEYRVQLWGIEFENQQPGLIWEGKAVVSS